MQIERTVTTTVTTFVLKTTKALGFNGVSRVAGTIVEVSHAEAGDLLTRKVAVRATEAEVAAAGSSLVQTGTVDGPPDPLKWREAVTAAWDA